MSLFVCLTTVRPPTAAVRALVARLTMENQCCAVVAGDQKGPSRFNLNGTLFLGLEAQLGGPFDLARKLPIGHYSRKNIAYLESIRRGAALIYETDDDNAPLKSWTVRGEQVREVRVVASPSSVLEREGRWVNVYKYFTGSLIWPRGLPLDSIQGDPPEAVVAKPGDDAILRAPIQQGLVNGSPDVDAIWRLTMDRPFEFDSGLSVCLRPGNWCPFNSQSTWWWPMAYPLMYIPSNCTFRMCDIWRGLVAQRCLWAMGYGVVFHPPEAMQERNVHDLMRDFHDELPGYERNAEMAEMLGALSLEPGPGRAGANLRQCYRMLVNAGFCPPEELALVDAWLHDLSKAS